MHVHLHTGCSFNQAVILKFLLLCTVIVAKIAAISQVETATSGYLHDG
jgi:hypothetical protein